jgi:hypothetical protein
MIPDSGTFSKAANPFFDYSSASVKSVRMVQCDVSYTCSLLQELEVQ